MQPTLQISSMPMMATLLVVGIVGMLILILALSKTKTATNEARLGHFEIILLPSGKRLKGIVTLARGLVSPMLTYTLAKEKVISRDQADILQENFKKLHFYGLKMGRRYLIVSSANLEDPQYALVTSQVFSFPFGYVSHRLVIGDAVETERAGWKIVVIDPRNLETNVTPATFETMINIGDASASVNEAAIKLKKELPWKKIAKARESQLEDVHKKLAEKTAEVTVSKTALASKSLFDEEEKTEELGKAKEGGITFFRLFAGAFAAAATFYLIPLWFMADPVLPAVIMGVGVFLFYNKLLKIGKRLFG